MLAERRILVSLLSLVEYLPSPPPPQKRKRGRQETYSDKLFIKALIRNMAELSSVECLRTIASKSLT